MCEFEGWTRWIEPAFLLWKPEDRDYERPPYMTQTEAKFTPEEELEYMHKQVNDSDGFDIDFSPLVCIFNYHLAILDSDYFVDEPETTGDLLDKLSRDSLDDYNGKHETKFEFDKVVKANFHGSAGIMFLITFQVIDPYDNLTKLFQTRIRHAKDIFTEFVYCRPKPKQGVDCIGNVKKVVAEKVVKKQRVE